MNGDKVLRTSAIGRGPGKVAWFGPVRGEFGYLYSQISTWFEPPADLNIDSVPHNIHAFAELASEHRVQRLIVALPGRLDGIPVIDTEIPIALALGTWWKGAGRTGAPLPYPSMPWNRWWDRWMPWLQGKPSEWLAAVPPKHLVEFEFLERDTDNTGLEVTLNSAVVLVTNQLDCFADSTLIQRGLGRRVLAVRPEQFFLSEQPWNQGSWELEAVVWDDSCTDTSFAACKEGGHFGAEFFSTVADKFPKALRVALVHDFDYAGFQQLEAGLVHEVLVKPSTLKAFGNLLDAYARRADFASVGAD